MCPTQPPADTGPRGPGQRQKIKTLLPIIKNNNIEQQSQIFPSVLQTLIFQRREIYSSLNSQGCYHPPSSRIFSYCINDHLLRVCTENRVCSRGFSPLVACFLMERNKRTARRSTHGKAQRKQLSLKTACAS